MATEFLEAFSDILGEKIDIFMKNNPELNLAAIAKGIDISEGALNMYLNAKREPKISSLLAIARYLKVSPNELLCPCEKFWEDDDNNGLLSTQIHSYTGLSREAIEVLHNEKRSPFFTPVINALIEDNEGGDILLDDIVNYMTADLWNDLGKEDIYNALPGSAFDIAMETGVPTSNYKEREGLVLISTKLAKVKEWFYKNTICENKKTRRDFLRLFAMNNIRVGDVLRILYPSGALEFMREKHVGLSEQFMDGYESLLRQDYEEDNPEFKDYKGFVPKCYLDVEEYLFSTAVTSTMPSDDELSWRREQAYNFMREYIEYSRSKTAK